MDLAKHLLRTTVRAFYTTEHTLIIDALAIHSTLTDIDLAHVLGMQPKALRRLCGKLKEDGLISVQSRGEKKEGAPPASSASQPGGFKERLFYRDWYYLNYHRAIDSLKYRLWRLSRHIESLGAPTTEKKDLVCPRCKSQYTELEVMDNIGAQGFLCHMCGGLLNAADESETQGENESMKRLNDQLTRIVNLMRQIDSTNVPENDFDTALSHALPIARSDANPARKMQIVDDAKPSLASAKGLQLIPEEVSVSVTEDGKEIKDPNSAALKRENEAKQNMLPDWISKSTISGDITAVGAKEAAERAVREAQVAGLRVEDAVPEEKKSRDSDSAVMDEYWAELKAAQERERLAQEQEDEDEEDDDDDFEDVDIAAAVVPVVRVEGAASTADDEEGDRAAKRVRLDIPVSTNGTAGVKAESNGAISDEDELEFEDA